MVLQTRIARAKAEPEAEAKAEEPAVDRLNRKMLALRADKGSKDEWLALNNEAIEAGLTFDDRAGRYVEGACMKEPPGVEREGPNGVHGSKEEWVVDGSFISGR